MRARASVSQDNLVKAREFIEAYNRRDFDAAVESFDPLVEWVLPERQSADSCVGPARIRRFWEQLDEHMEELQLVPQEFVDAGERVATRLRHRGRGKGSGVELDQELYHQVISFREGRMVRIEYFAEWAEALEAAGVADQPGR
jgi:ketosteroid isomerase-like protein